MTMIIGYGEDALTFWALSHRMPDILQALDDDTAPNAAVVFFRPSAGRGERGGAEVRRSLFGEFDAIIGTRIGVYLVEAKWHRSTGVRGGRVKLADVQHRRHEIFATYLELWRAATPAAQSDWATFAGGARATFEGRHDGWRLVESDISTANIRFILEHLTDCGPRVENVLLFIGKAGTPVPTAPAKFRRVALEYDPIAGGDFLDTGISVGTP
jgi:hypothetical protein